MTQGDGGVGASSARLVREMVDGPTNEETPRLRTYDAFGSAEKILQFLRDPTLYVRSITEHLTDNGSEISRSVRMSVDLPKGDTSRDNPSMILIAQKPVKGVLINASALSDQPSIRVHRLSHNQHKRLEKWLILTRLNSWFSSVVVRKRFDSEALVIKNTLVHKLVSLPTNTVEESRAAYTEVFWSPQSLIKKLHRDTANGGLGASSDLSQLVRLQRLCRELALRYYVAYRIEAKLPTPGTITFEYNYVQHFTVKADNFRGRLRNARGSAPLSMRIHIPLARTTNHYTATMVAPIGYYFAQQSILSEDNVAGKALAYRDFDSRRVPSGISNVENDVSREIAGGTLGHIFFAQGPRVGKRLFAGFTLREMPPGFTGRAYSIVRLTLLAAMLLTLWKLANPNSTSIAAVLATILSLGSYLIDARVADAPLLQAPVLPRILLQIQSLVTITFAVWLLGSFPSNRGTALSDWDHLAIWWYYGGGWVAVGSLMGMAILLRWRLVRSRRKLADVVRERHAKIPPILLAEFTEESIIK